MLVTLQTVLPSSISCFQLIRFKLIGKFKLTNITKSYANNQGFQLIRFKLIGKYVKKPLDQSLLCLRWNVSN